MSCPSREGGNRLAGEGSSSSAGRLGFLTDIRFVLNVARPPDVPFQHGPYGLLDRLDEGIWRLELYPDVAWVHDPTSSGRNVRPRPPESASIVATSEPDSASPSATREAYTPRCSASATPWPRPPT